MVDHSLFILITTTWNHNISKKILFVWNQVTFEFMSNKFITSQRNRSGLTRFLLDLPDHPHRQQRPRRRLTIEYHAAELVAVHYHIQTHITLGINYWLSYTNPHNFGHKLLTVISVLCMAHSTIHQIFYFSRKMHRTFAGSILIQIVSVIKEGLARWCAVNFSIVSWHMLTAHNCPA